MADHKIVFERVMFSALTQADSELKQKRLDNVEIAKALTELQNLVHPLANCHFGEFDIVLIMVLEILFRFSIVWRITGTGNSCEGW